jgi:endonuclease/exonuclease/phosphatase family metal-dependent hydrolase
VARQVRECTGAAGTRPLASARRIRVLTWNLFHGRAQPAAGRPLLVEFSRALAAWDWDVALLQEVPPWWPARLGAAARAGGRSARTSRNLFLPARRAIAARNPDLLAASGGGANAILVRGDRIAEHRVRRLTRRPERRVMHGVRLAAGGWVVNVHASHHPPEQRRADLLLAARTAQAWAADAPLVFGGDLNATRPAFAGLRHVARHHVDHLFAAGLEPAGPWELLDAGTLSDHRPLAVTLTGSAARTPAASAARAR